MRRAVQQTLRRMWQACLEGETGPITPGEFLIELLMVGALALSFVVLMAGASLAIGGAT